MQLLSFVVFSFGASAFTVLLLPYWRNAKKGNILLRLFTAVCALAFVSNLVPALAPAQAIAAGSGVPWMAAVGVVYAAALRFDLAREGAWGERTQQAPAMILAVSATLSAARLLYDKADAATLRRRLLLSLFFSLLVCGLAAAFGSNPLFEIAPDYLVLLFFAVHL